MNITRHALDMAARDAAAARNEMFRATVHLAPDGDTELGRAVAESALEHAEAALDRLIQMGAHLERAPDDHEDAHSSLHRLMRLSTPATRHLLDALRDAVTAAEAVDAERGDVLPAEVGIVPGEPHGTGWAETIHALAERLRLEVEGPRSHRGE